MSVGVVAVVSVVGVVFIESEDVFVSYCHLFSLLKLPQHSGIDHSPSPPAQLNWNPLSPSQLVHGHLLQNKTYYVDK